MTRREMLFSSGAALVSITSDLEKEIRNALEETKVPGASIAIISDAKVKWAKGFGVQDTVSKIPVDQQTIFQAASMSKPVFAYVVMKLAEKGVLDLDAPLTKYVSERLVPDDSRLDLITARRVLSHSTGLPNWRSAKEPLRIKFTPGERFRYSGEGYSYLQSVVSRLTGHVSQTDCQGGYEEGVRICATDIASYLKTNLLVPFGMNSSGYEPIPLPKKQIALGHDQNGVSLKVVHWRSTDAARYAAAAGLLTTPSDYARFLIEVLNPKPTDAYHLTEKSLNEMLRPETTIRRTDEDEVFCTMGWRLTRTRGITLIGHGGHNSGFHCLSEVLQKDRSGFVIMTNGESGAKLIERIAPKLSRDLHSS